MKMKNGYDTQVGDLGGVLSGGERQRIVIARSLLKKDAQIFLFDEATSALDPYTEQTLADELDTIMKGKTVIFCAHRLASIKNVERIHVLKDGKVKEVGSHADLMSNPDSVYRDMWKALIKNKALSNNSPKETEYIEQQPQLQPA